MKVGGTLRCCGHRKFGNVWFIYPLIHPTLILNNCPILKHLNSDNQVHEF